MFKNTFSKIKNVSEIATNDIDKCCVEHGIVLKNRDEFIDLYKTYLITVWSCHAIGEACIACAGTIAVIAVCKSKAPKIIKAMGSWGAVIGASAASNYHTKDIINDRFLSDEGLKQFFFDHRDEWDYISDNSEADEIIIEKNDNPESENASETVINHYDD